jgi:hypothetical protein
MQLNGKPLTGEIAEIMVVTFDSGGVSYVDPLDIVNTFTTHTIDVDPYPTYDDYWLRKLCALAERCAMAEELVRHAWVHDGYVDCGFNQMTTEQKKRYQELIGREE